VTWITLPVIWITSASRIVRSGPAFYSQFSEVSAQEAAQTTDGARLNAVLHIDTVRHEAGIARP
jgi:hypothetical protein